MIADRLVPFDRVLNFRDFGGYETADGARIKRNLLYRSAAFAEASDADVAKLNTMGVGLLVDLRRPDERNREPNRWGPAQVVSNDEGPQDGLPPHLQALLRDGLTAEMTAGYMHQIYRGFAFEPRHIALYRAWFENLSTNDGAAILHCAAGKDRTGLGCALTLIALGVPEDAVYADYELTNQALDLSQRLPQIQARIEASLQRKIDADALRPMLGVDVDYLRGAFASIDAKHGDALTYLEEVLGVGPREREALQAKLTA